MSEARNSIVDKFTNDEKKAIKDLKELLPEILNGANAPENYTLWEVALDKDSKDERLDVILIKFLRARSFDVNKSKEMMKKCIEWRIGFNADELLTETFPSSIFAKIGFIHKHDKEFRPVTYNLYGRINNQEIFGNMDQFIRWRMQLMEKGIKLLDFANVDQMIQVHDYNLVTYSSYDKTAKQASKLVTEIMQENYPEFLAVKLFVNIPWWGEWIFKFISMFLSEQTKKKFVLTSADRVKEIMLALIDEENLPTFYGGKSVVRGFENDNIGST
ncbi:18740_t:CDS:2 [Funneliformis geosporum]|uniref:5584_t:CDS:1 n=1 Tax=Funneliformis geosporum TaxID=1117311 RepID=A0A9W4SK09_9GLOM|nr:18740_t:CDS:2 [Funneliformis geosporum]CAI2171904.1 5584_t:CDS:2 [Funneliformis geosporum]